MSNNPLGPDEPREGEFSRVERAVPFVGMGQGIERIIQVFGEFGNVIEKIVVKTETANTTIAFLGKKLAEMEAIFGKNVTQVDAYNIGQERLAKAIASSASVELLSQGINSASDSAANFANVLSLMQQNLDANVIVAKSIAGRDKRREAAQKKRDKERDKSILGISKAAIAMKLFNAVMGQVKKGINSFQSGFEKNFSPIFDSISTFGEAVGAQFLPFMEDTVEFFNKLTELSLREHDAAQNALILRDRISDLIEGDQGLLDAFGGVGGAFRLAVETFNPIQREQRMQDLLDNIKSFILTRQTEVDAVEADAAELIEETKLQTELLANMLEVLTVDVTGVGAGITQNVIQGIFGGHFTQ